MLSILFKEDDIDVDAKDGRGIQTPLALAVKAKNGQAVKLLIGYNTRNTGCPWKLWQAIDIFCSKFLYMLELQSKGKYKCKKLVSCKIYDTEIMRTFGVFQFNIAKRSKSNRNSVGTAKLHQMSVYRHGKKLHRHSKKGHIKEIERIGPAIVFITVLEQDKFKALESNKKSYKIM